MSFVPKMQNYFGKDSDFSKMSNLYGDAAAFQQTAHMKGDLIRQQAADRAQMRLLAGEYAKEQGQAAGSAAVNNSWVDFGQNVAMGAIQGGFNEGGIFNKGLNNGDPGTFGDGLGTGHTDYSWNASPKNYEPGSISSPGWSWDDL